MESQGKSIAPAPAVHSYRDSSTIVGELVGVVGVAFAAFFVQLFLGNGTLHLDNGKPLRPTFAFHTVVLGVCVLLVVAFALNRIFRWLNERIVVDGEMISWRTRFGRVVECRTDEIASYQRTWNSFLGRPKYIVDTPAGEIRYSRDISRLSELNRFFTTLTGGIIPAPAPSPRHWMGSTTYSCRSFGTLALAAVYLFILGKEIWVIWWNQHSHHPFLLSDPFMVAAICCLAGCVASQIGKFAYQAVTIDKDQLIYRNLWGRELVRVQLDEIQSVDIQPNHYIAKVYTPDRMFRIDQSLRGYKELVEKLQWMTASPNP